jgi:hypothetical protein
MAKKKNTPVSVDSYDRTPRTIAMSSQTVDKLPMGKELYGEGWDQAPYGENGFSGIATTGRCRGVASYVQQKKIVRGNDGIGRGK